MTGIISFEHVSKGESISVCCDSGADIEIEAPDGTIALRFNQQHCDVTHVPGTTTLAPALLALIESLPDEMDVEIVPDGEGGYRVQPL